MSTQHQWRIHLVVIYGDHKQVESYRVKAATRQEAIDKAMLEARKLGRPDETVGPEVTELF